MLLDLNAITSILFANRNVFISYILVSSVYFSFVKLRIFLLNSHLSVAVFNLVRLLLILGVDFVCLSVVNDSL